MPNINVTVADKIATNMSPGVLIVCGNSDYTVTFDFDSEWDSMETKTARFLFYKQGRSWYTDTKFTGNTVQVPVLSGVDFVLAGAYAGELHTTTPARILCSRSILCDDGTELIDGPTRENLEDLIAEIERLLASGAFIGPPGPAGADGTVTFEDLTEEQRETLRGPQGDPFTYDDFTEEQLEALRGPQGEQGAPGTVAFEDLTEAQRESLRGPQGDTGPQGPKGEQGVSGVWVGNSKPTDKQYKVWVNPEAGESSIYGLAGDAYNLANDANEKVDALADTVSRLHGEAGAIVETVSGAVVAVSDASDNNLAGLRIFGKTTQNGTPAPTAPVPLEIAGDSGTINFMVRGKNLVIDTRSSKADATSNGITFTTNADGTVIANGTTTDPGSRGYCALTARNGWLYLPKGTYTISSGLQGLQNSEQAYVQITYNDIAGSENPGGAEHIYEKPETLVFDKPKWCWIAACVTKGNTAENLVFKPQIEAGTEATAYEPYRTPQTAALTVNGLPGVKVTSGGNYTDKNGQQWICDEVDFEKGVYVQRIQTVKLSDMKGGYNGANFYFTSIKDKKLGRSNLLCSHYPVGSNTSKTYCTGSSSDTYLFIYDPNYTDMATLKADLGDAVFLYELAEEKQIDLTTEELAQFAALRTHKPNTTAYNDAGAEMEVQYIADTKLYIDKKFDQLAMAMLNQ